MLTFKPFTILLNITLNKPTLCVKTRYVDVEPYAVNRLCLSMRNVRDYYRSEDYHRVATLSMHSLWLPGGLAPPGRVISNRRKSVYERHTASTEAYSVKMAALFSAIIRFALRQKL